MALCGSHRRRDWRMDWRRTDGLRRMFKAASFKKLACMTNADTESIIHVSDSLQIRRILHEMITCTATCTEPRDASRWHVRTKCASSPDSCAC